MPLRKNVAGQKIAYFVQNQEAGFDFASGSFSPAYLAGNTGQASALTTATDLSLDGGAVQAPANSWVELDSVNAPGVYILTLSQAETNCDKLSVSFSPSTESTFRKPWPRAKVYFTDPDWESRLIGAGHTPPGDTLTEIRNTLDATFFPAFRAGQPATELSGTGWLSALVTRIREWTDNPSTSSKFNPSRMYEAIKSSTRELFGDPAINGGKRLVVRMNVSFTEGETDYVLPPNVGSILRVAKLDPVTGEVGSEIRPGGFHQPYPVSWRVEGNVLRLAYSGTSIEGETYEIAYLPSGDFQPCLFTASSIGGDGMTVVLPTTVTDGVLDYRANAYAGAVFRIVSATANRLGQICPIAAYDNATRTITLRTPLSPLPTGTVVGEIIPVYSELFKDVLALHVARSLVVSMVDQNRFHMLTRKYAEAARALRLSMAQWQKRESTRFDGRSRSNEDYTAGQDWWWWL